MKEKRIIAFLAFNSGVVLSFVSNTYFYKIIFIIYAAYFGIKYVYYLFKNSEKTK